jgi:transcriptional regulator with XRE-family HTH domain
MTIDEMIGERIKNRRIELHISQEELAIKANINRSYISIIEKGKKSLTIKTLDSIRNALKVDFSYFFSSGSDANS